MPKALPLLDTTSPICCAPLASNPVDADTALEIALRLKALADPVRVQLFSMILTAAGGEACNCDLAPAVGLSDATVSHHLKALREAGLIVGERRGTWVYYAPVREALGALAKVLDPDQASGSASSSAAAARRARAASTAAPIAAPPPIATSGSAPV